VTLQEGVWNIQEEKEDKKVGRKHLNEKVLTVKCREKLMWRCG